MAIATGTALALGATGLLGGLAGGAGKNSSSQSGVDAGAATGAENMGQQGMLNAYNQLQGMTDAGPGQSDVTASLDSSRGLADMLKQYSEGGYNPSAGDITTSNQQAAALFGGQRVGMQQAFDDQRTQANRVAGLSGRNINDPILQAKLAQEQTRQSSVLDANQGSFAQQLAMQAPMQRLGFAQQRAGVLGGLATQAMQNRQMIAAMGEGIMNNERNFRLQTATRWGNEQSGGGAGGAITGALGGIGAGASLATGLSNSGLFSTPAPNYSTPQTSAPFGGFGFGGSNIFGVGSFGGR